jgi:hypothetical protein
MKQKLWVMLEIEMTKCARQLLGVLRRHFSTRQSLSHSDCGDRCSSAPGSPRPRERALKPTSLPKFTPVTLTLCAKGSRYGIDAVRTRVRDAFATATNPAAAPRDCSVLHSPSPCSLDFSSPTWTTLCIFPCKPAYQLEKTQRRRRRAGRGFPPQRPSQRLLPPRPTAAS